MDNTTIASSIEQNICELQVDLHGQKTLLPLTGA
jgi:hypothetical protein